MKNRRYRCTRPARRTIKAVVTLLGAILLFRWWSAIAYTTRGYKAIGGWRPRKWPDLKRFPVLYLT